MKIRLTASRGLAQNSDANTVDSNSEVDMNGTQNRFMKAQKSPESCMSESTVSSAWLIAL